MTGYSSSSILRRRRVFRNNKSSRFHQENNNRTLCLARLDSMTPGQTIVAFQDDPLTGHGQKIPFCFSSFICDASSSQQFHRAKPTAIHSKCLRGRIKRKSFSQVHCFCNILNDDPILFCITRCINRFIDFDDAAFHGVTIPSSSSCSEPGRIMSACLALSFKKKSMTT